MNVNKSKTDPLSLFSIPFYSQKKNFILQQAQMSGSLHFLVLILDKAMS